MTGWLRRLYRRLRNRCLACGGPRYVASLTTRMNYHAVRAWESNWCYDCAKRANHMDGYRGQP